MPLQIAPIGAHPAGEPNSSVISPSEAAAALQPVRLPVDVHGKRLYVEWDPYAPVTPLGQLVYFSQFLASAGLFGRWVGNCPLRYTSPNAPTLNDVLGTITLSILAGHRRYSQVTALRGDTVNPQGLGMSEVLSEDAVRRAFQDEDPQPLEQWQREHLLHSVEPVLQEPWICDIDVTIKTIYGKQEGAEVGYNPHKPGRPAHAYHTFFISRLRLALDVVVVPGNFTAARLGKRSGNGGSSCRRRSDRGCCGGIVPLATKTSWWTAKPVTSPICSVCASAPGASG
jgi:hypothetical protein